MKNILKIVFLISSLNTFANSPEGTPIEVPYPAQQNAFYGTISTVEAELKKDLMDKAITACGTKENLSQISNVEVKISFSSINKRNKIFLGGYPLASATALAHCFQ